MKRTIVVARFKEDISWLDRLDPAIERFVVQKDVHLPNKGREASSYLWYIRNHYDAMRGIYIFCQGNPFDHCPNFISWLDSVAEADRIFFSRGRCYATQVWGTFLNFYECCMLLGLPILPSYVFYGGAQFQLATWRITQRPKWFYENAYEISMNRHPAAWELERLWPTIFPE